MALSRRMFLAGAACAVSLTPLTADALSDKLKELVEVFAGGTPSEGGVSLTVPEIAENGNNVPVSFLVDADPADIELVAIFADGNPNPEVATVAFGPLAGDASAGVRMRLATTQNVAVVAKMRDGAARIAAAEVKVTIGGCGG